MDAQWTEPPRHQKFLRILNVLMYTVTSREYQKSSCLNLFDHRTILEGKDFQGIDYHTYGLRDIDLMTLSWKSKTEL